MTTSYAQDPTVRAALAQLPPAGPLADRAAELVASHERCAVTSAGALPGLPEATTTERAELVELYRLGLLTELGELADVARRTPVAEGGLL